MIKGGYVAELVIYDRDFMIGQEDEIMRALVDFTIVGGKVVYRRYKPSFDSPVSPGGSGCCPEPPPAISNRDPRVVA